MRSKRRSSGASGRCVWGADLLAVEIFASRLTLIGFATRAGGYNLYAGEVRGE